jgi:hypothetical protein
MMLEAAKDCCLKTRAHDLKISYSNMLIPDLSQVVATVSFLLSSYTSLYSETADLEDL